jgi:hypothetical protein
MRFVYLGSRFTLRASFPRSVTLTQLRFTCLAVASSAGDLHPEDRAHAGRTSERAAIAALFHWGVRLSGAAVAEHPVDVDELGHAVREVLQRARGHRRGEALGGLVGL